MVSPEFPHKYGKNAGKSDNRQIFSTPVSKVNIEKQTSKLSLREGLQSYASPAPKATKTLLNVTFNKAFANVKNGSALGISMNAIVGICISWLFVQTHYIPYDAIFVASLNLV